MNAALKLMTPEAFLLWCLDQPDRWELVHGVPIRMMTGATQAHDRIVVSIIADLHQRLRGKPCRAHTADVASRMPEGNIRRPDVTIDCGPSDARSLESSAPTVFFEVLSPSTRTFDKVRKPEEYKGVPSLRHIVLIDPDRPRVWLWSRGEEGPWGDEDIDGLDGVIALTALGLTLPLATVYEDVELEA